MKKYNQLILTITTVISVTLLLIYRHEYNRLRYVLEVFNFFGQPPQCTYADILNTTALSQHDWGPTPVFQSVEDSFIYSAFLKYENDAEALVINNDNKVNKAGMKFCYFWFENKPKPIIGKLRYTKISPLDDTNEYSLYKYYCHLDSITQIPYAISFTNKNKRTIELKKIMLNPVHKKKTNTSDFSTICVIPSLTYSKAAIIEFLSYHRIIGIDTFIIYNNNIPHKFLHTLENLSTRLGLHITTYPWNYPGRTTTQTRKIIEEDCLLRSKNQSRNMIVLDFSEYIVPKFHHTLPAMLDHYDPKNRTQRFTLKTLVFCTTNYDHREHTVLQNFFYDTAKPEESLFLYRSTPIIEDVINTQEISPGIAAIHRYIQCASHPAHSKREDSILRFAPDLRKSTLFKLLKYDRL